MSKRKQNILNLDNIERFEPDAHQGLTDSLVELRKTQKLVNLTKDKKKGGYAEIFIRPRC